MPLWHHICLCGTPFTFINGIYLNGTLFAFWCPHLPYRRPICLYGATSAFWCPICLLQAPSAFWLSKFFEKTHDKICPAAKRGPGFRFPGCNLWMIQSSCATTNQLYQLLLQASFPRVRMCPNLSHHFVWAHKIES